MFFFFSFYFSLLLLLLMKLLYNICRVSGFEPEILRMQTGVLPLSYTHPWQHIFIVNFQAALKKTIFSFQYYFKHWLCTVPKIIWLTAYKDQAHHSWRRCSGICPVFIYIQYIHLAQKPEVNCRIHVPTVICSSMLRFRLFLGQCKICLWLYILKKTFLQSFYILHGDCMYRSRFKNAMKCILHS